MTGKCSKNITPDSLTGMIFALEGVKNAIVLVNGPMGCKFYHSTTSQYQMLRPGLFVEKDGKKVPVNQDYLNSWFFRQQRVPCTYLDGYDYVYGTEEKAAEALRYLKGNITFALMAIVNSPGAALIGDDLREMAREILPDCPCVVLESPGYSRDVSFGYREAARGLLEQLWEMYWKPSASPDPSLLENVPAGAPMDVLGNAQENVSKEARSADSRPRVNVLGLSIWERYADGDIRELRRLFALCGIEVSCFLCAQCSLEELKRLPEADLNVVLDPVRGEESARFLKERTGVPYYLCETLPVGFKATEKMLRDICGLLGADPAAFLEESGRARALAWYKINQVYEMCGLPRGVTFAVEGTAAQVFAYTRFFVEYLGMVPDALACTEEEGEEDRQRLSDFLAAHDASDVLLKEMEETDAELLFGDANRIAAQMLSGKVFCGIEINLPGMGYVDVTPKTHLGIGGALFLIEQVLNGLMSKV